MKAHYWKVTNKREQSIFIFVADTVVGAETPEDRALRLARNDGRIGRTDLTAVRDVEA